MKRTVLVTILFALLVAVAGIGTGCEDPKQQTQDNMLLSYAAAGHQGKPEITGDIITPSKGEKPPSDHEITAMFILQQAGANSDLSSYGSVELVKYKKPDGSEIMGVYVNDSYTIFASDKK